MKKLISIVFLVFLVFLCSCRKKQTFNVKFIGFNDTIILEQNYQENENLIYPKPEEIKGYIFIGWDYDIKKVTDDLVIKAIYKKKSYIVEFKTQFGDIIKSDELYYNDVITYPNPPSFEGYSFIKWDQDIKNVSENVTITALYQEIKNTISFKTQFGDIIKIEKIGNDEKIIYPEAPVIEGYHFIGWDYDIEYADSDLVITAKYEKKVYNVTFKTQFGDLIDEKQYSYLDVIIYPNPLQIEGYNFVSWSSNEDYVTTNMEIIAYYNIMQFTVTFIGLDENIIGKITVNYMTPFLYPEAPIVEGYTFIGWDQNLIGVKQDTKIVAIYKKNNIDVEVVNSVFSNVENVLLLDGMIENRSNEQIQRLFVDINDERVNYELDVNNHFSLSITTSFEKSSKININFYIELSNGNIIKIYEEEYLMYIEIKTSNYISYVDNLSLNDPLDITAILEELNPQENHIITIDNIIYGGYRGTNELHLYDSSNYRKCNSYGHEIAINQDGFVVDSKTLVDLPTDGFILSGHGTSSTLLQKNIQIGDYIIYNQIEKKVYVYRSEVISSLISLRESIFLAKEKLIKAYNNLLALDYQKLFSIYNQVLDDFATILDFYDNQIIIQIKNNLAKLHFGVIETKFLEVKAFWHYPMRANGYPENNKNEVCLFLNQVKAMGFNTIYINTNFNGGTIYPSKYLKQLKANNFVYDGYNDYLECFISEAHNRNLRVVAWSNTFICGDGYLPSHSPSKYVSLDYHGKDNSGNIYFYDITNPEVQELLVNVYKELATNYDLDGIEYDFVRYPASNLYTFSGNIIDSSLIDDFGYTESAISLFKERYNLDGNIKELILSSDDIRNKWQTFKVSNVTNMVKMISTAIKEANPSIMISAAVMSSLSSAIQTYAQDFGTWIKEGYVDNLDPMIYSGSNSYVLSRVELFIETVNDDASIVIGISPDNSGGNVITISEQIEIISKYLQLGFNEFSCKNIFSSEEIINGFMMLERDYNSTIYDDFDTIRKKYAQSMLDRLTNYYQYLSIMSNCKELIRLYNLLYSNLIDISVIKIELNKIENETIKNKLILEFEYIEMVLEEK